MRVLLLTWEYPPIIVGGLGRHVYALSTALVEQGHEVTVVTRHVAGAPVVEYLDGVRVVRAPEDPPFVPLETTNLLAWTMGFNHSVARAALREARNTRFDLVHAHDWLVAHAAVTLKEQLGLPLVSTIHATEAGRHQGWLPHDLNRSIHSVECWLVNESGRVVVCSHYMRWEVHHLLKAPHRRIDVVPNGVDIATWQADQDEVTAARWRYAGEAPLIGFAGRLVYEKGVQDIVRALPDLRSRHPGLRLVIAGDGPYRPQLEEEVRRLGLDPAVSFAGFLGRDLPAVIASTDAMVVPSIYEPFGMVALEAAAAGVPVAAAAVGGLREIVEPGRTGATFPPANPAALADAVSRLLGNAEEARRMVRTARHMVASRYAWDTIAHRTARVYGAAGREPAPPAPARRSPATANGRLAVAPDGDLLRDLRTPSPVYLRAGHRARV
jgi:glycogen(starch) synthase